MNLFWLGVGGGSLIIIHILILIFLRWRTGTSAHGILSVPRFELFLLILMLPCISQSSAFVIRGKKLFLCLFFYKDFNQFTSRFCELKTTIICRWYNRGNNCWGSFTSNPCCPYFLSVPLSYSCNLLWQFCSV